MNIHNHFFRRRCHSCGGDEDGLFERFLRGAGASLLIIYKGRSAVNVKSQSSPEIAGRDAIPICGVFTFGVGRMLHGPVCQCLWFWAAPCATSRKSSAVPRNINQSFLRHFTGGRRAVRVSLLADG